ncbi:MAG: LVIVD repeat-containing protein [Thermoanaerobaculia bacterium]
MRKVFRIFLLGILSSFILIASAPAEHTVANCPLTLVGESAATTDFDTSPHALFRNGDVAWALRGQTLTTFAITELGDIQVARRDQMSTLSARDRDGAVAYGGGYMFISSEAGLEIFDLRNTRPGANPSAPTLVSRTPGWHYRRMAVTGNLLAAVYPINDMSCAPFRDANCRNYVDIFSIADLSSPVLIARIVSNPPFYGFSDVAFANGYLYVTGLSGTRVFSVANPSAPSMVAAYPVIGTYLVTNGSTFMGIGQETLIGVFTIAPTFQLNYFAVFTLPSIVGRQNPLMFHPDGWFMESGLVMMVDEKNPATGKPARTVAFDVFDFTAPFWDGADDRTYENVSWMEFDEVKHDVMTVGPYVYVTGEKTGVQVYGVCNQMAGAIEFDTLSGLPCGGAEIHGWVTGETKITEVELFLDNASLGLASLGKLRPDVSSRTPAVGWSMSVNLDQTAEGQGMLRAIGTDINGNRRQFASRNVYFPGPGGNCTNRRRGAKR